MVNRLELAKQFIQEVLSERDDVIAAMVVGSVARGEDTDGSDIDLPFIVKEDEGEVNRSLAHWREGVFIESGVRTKDEYNDFDQVMRGGHVTQIHDALVLYDPTGFFTELQKKVRAAYMEPKWLGIRVHQALNRAQEAMQRLLKVIAAEDHIGICCNGQAVIGGLIRVPLLREGITPSSTRSLLLLRKIQPDLTEKICDLQVSSSLSDDDVLALHSLLLEEAMPLVGPGMSKLWEYGLKKTVLLVDTEERRAALSLMWTGLGIAACGWRSHGDREVIAKATEVSNKWLQGVSWEGRKVLQGKVEVAKSLLMEIETFAVGLPTPDSL